MATPEEILNNHAASLNPELVKSLLLGLKQRVTRAATKERARTGYVESKLKLAPDVIRNASITKDKQALAAKAKEFDKLFKKIPETIGKTALKALEPKPLNARQLAYRKRVRENEEFALKCIKNLMGFPDKNGNRPKLSAFERELKAELKKAQAEGINIFFLYDHKTFHETDPVILRIKELEAQFKEEDKIESFTSSLSEAQLSTLEEIAVLALNSL
jgi:hypothetical protein